MPISQPDSPQTDFAHSEDYVSLKKTQEKIEQPAEFAKVFVEAAESQFTIRKTISSMITELIASDVTTREELKELIKQVETKDLFLLLKRIWGVLSALLWLVVGVIITKLIG